MEKAGDQQFGNILLEVIAPEVIAFMISEDMKISVEEAKAVLEDSVAVLYGRLVQEDEIPVDETTPRPARRNRRRGEKK